jgi:hypothetical protein
LHANGPTYSVQPLPEALSGYKNIASSAKITADNIGVGAVSLLNDGIIKFQPTDTASEFKTGAGATTFTLSWDSPKTARAILIYNSSEYENSFTQIDYIEIEYESGKSVRIDKCAYDFAFLADGELMLPGGAVVAEFYEMPVIKITFKITSPTAGEGVSVPEITVLGKERTVPLVKFAKYGYSNPETGSPELINESRTFGNIGGLTTMYGYDLSHDDGADGAYITQEFVFDQLAFFKDVYSTKFYVEAEFTVTEPQAFPYPPYGVDPAPKFGLTVANSLNTIFFYVDAAGFTKKTVGVAQRKLDNSDWDWNATEKLVDAPEMNYTGGRTVRLAIIRDGRHFDMLVDGKIVMTYDNFNVFNDDMQAAVGFRAFSTGLKITNYFATDDGSAVDGYFARYEDNK